MQPIDKANDNKQDNHTDHPEEPHKQEDHENL